MDATLDFDGDLEVIPGVRRFVRDRLAEWGWAQLSADAELAATELVTNGVLHAGPPLRLRLATAAEGVRIEVADPSKAFPLPTRASDEAMTGRGLALVQALSSKFGVDGTHGGKVVWCELSAHAQPAPATDLDAEQLLAAWAEPEAGPATTGERYTIELGDVPVDLLIGAKAHVDNLVREFTLARAGALTGTSAELPAHLAELLATVVDRFAEPRLEIKRQAVEAAARGAQRVRLTLHVLPEVAEAGEEYLVALDEADAYARAARLLTLESPPPYRLFRRWYVEELLKQLRRATAGLPPLPPQTFEARLINELGAVAEAQRVSERAARLQTVAAALARAGTPQEVADVALREVVGALAAEGGAAILPTPDAGLEVAGVVGYPPSVVERLRRQPADAPLPSGQALRTGEPVWLDSREDIARHFPAVLDLEPDSAALCVLPLRLGTSVLGVLRVSFDLPRLFDEEDRRFMLAVAAQAAQALDRTLQDRLRAESYEEQREVAQRLARLQTFSSELATTRGVDEVFDAIGKHALQRLGADLVTVCLPTEDDEHLAIAYAKGDSGSLHLFQRFRIDAHLPAADVYRSGVPVVFHDRTERDQRYPELASVTAPPGHGAATLPLIANDRVIGTLGLAWGNQGPRSDADREFLSAMADTCAQALDRARTLEDAERRLEQLRFLSQAAAELAKSFDYETTLANIAQLAVPKLADWCTVHIAEEGRLRTLAVAHADPEMRQLAVALEERFPPDPAAPAGVPNVIRTGRSELWSEITDELLESRGIKNDRLRTLRELNLGSAMFVPLHASGNVIGAISMLVTNRRRRYRTVDLTFAEELARQCDQELERTRLFAAERAARERSAFLAEATEILASSLDPGTTAAHLTQLVVGRFADWAIVYLLDDAGVPLPAAVQHRDPEVLSSLTQEVAATPLDADAPGGVGDALRTGRPVRDIAGTRLTASIAFHTGMAIPLVAGGVVLGVLALARTQGQPYPTDDVAIVEDVAARAAVAILNAQQYGRERDTALTLQHSLLPQRLPRVSGVSLAWRYLPGTAGVHVGGDWYDVLPLEDGVVGLIIGDVMGRGVQAAAVMGQLRATARAHASGHLPPSELLGALGAAVDRLEQAQITTAMFGLLDPEGRTLTIASAGHLPPLLISSEGADYLPLEPGPPLGAGVADFPELKVDLPQGATLLLFTDGLVESRSRSVDEGLAILRDTAAGSADPETVCNRALAALGGQGQLDDDTAMLAVTLNG